MHPDLPEAVRGAPRCSEMLSYVHPVVGAVVLALLAYVASLGARSLNDPRNAVAWRARHARIAPWAALAAFATGLLGLLTTWLLRPKLHVGQSGHFKCATALLVLVSGSALSSRWMDRAAVRAVHPWFGVAGLLIAAALFFFGLQITP